MNDQFLNENAQIFKSSLVNLCSNLHYLCKDVAQSHGISLKLANLLEIIYEQDGITLNNLCRKIDEDKGNLSRLVNDLMKDSYVIKKQSERDKRIYYIYITEYGKEAILKIETKYQTLDFLHLLLLIIYQFAFLKTIYSLISRLLK